jgi:hypothetical protein
MVRSPIAKLNGYLWAGVAKVDKIVAEKDPVGSRVGLDVLRIRAPVVEAVMRVGLAPTPRGGVPGVYVVSEGLFLTPAKVRLLALKVRFCPVFLEWHDSGDPHRVNEMFLTAVGL